MKRRAFIAALVLSVPGLSRAQKSARIGLLGLGLEKPLLDAFTGAMSGHGYVLGRNLSLVDRSGLQRYEMLASAAEELVKAQVDVIVTWGSSAPVAARKTTSTVPIVIVAGGDPVANGLVKSLARPGGNLTGIISQASELTGKQLQLLKELSPGVRKAALVLNPGSANEVRYIPIAEKEARRLGMGLHVAEIRTPEDFDAAFAAAAKADCTAVFVVASTMFLPYREKIAALALKHGMASVTSAPEYAAAGVLATQGANRIPMMRRAAGYVARILKGEQPGGMPIEQASEFELIINLKTAQALGLKISDVLRFRATRLIE